jgi:hypothetical protein
MTMLPEQQPQTNEEQNDSTTVQIDEAWIVARIIAILYFIEFQYGEEAVTAMEQVAANMEASFRGAEGNVQ